MASKKVKEIQQATSQFLSELEKKIEDANQTVSYEEFVSAFEQVVNMVLRETTNPKQFNAQEVAKMRSLVLEQANKLKTRFDTAVNNLNSSITTAVSRLEKEQQNTMNYMRDKADSLENGTDADEEAVAQLVYDRLKAEEPDESTEMKEIKLINDRLDAMEKSGKSKATIPAATPVGNRNLVKTVDLSSQLDGSTKTFKTQAFYGVLQVVCSSYPTAFRPTIDYTTDGNAGTITFTSEIDAASTLAAGQTLIALIMIN